MEKPSFILHTGDFSSKTLININQITRIQKDITGCHVYLSDGKDFKLSANAEKELYEILEIKID